ncbi:MAG: hypothetical protein Q7R72_02800 [bacterium]|nr:hypothetical protein [bacterium]
MKKARSVAPALHELDIPVWCHSHCTKMSVIQSSNESVLLCTHLDIKNCAVWVRIDKFPGQNLFCLEYKLTHGLENWATGKIVFSRETLRLAFAIDGFCSEHNQWILSEFGGDAAVPGKFIRWKDYVNFPGPGTGHSGDANVSVKIRPEMAEAIRRFTN